MYKLLSVSNRNEIIHKVSKDPDYPQRATIWFKNGFLYRGEVLENKLHGQGLLLLGDGSYYKGKFMNSFDFKGISIKTFFSRENGFISQVSSSRECFTRTDFIKESFIFQMETVSRESGL